MLSRPQTNKIYEMVKNLPIEVVYLFGSQAGSEARTDSDYDFGVLFSPNLSSHERFDMRLEILGFLTGVLKTDNVDVIDLKSSPIRFQYEAIKPRAIIYERDQKKVKDFEYGILTRYFDETYFMKQTTRDYLHKLAHDQTG